MNTIKKGLLSGCKQPIFNSTTVPQSRRKIITLNITMSQMNSQPLTDDQGMDHLQTLFDGPPLYTREGLQEAQRMLININSSGGQFITNDVYGVVKQKDYPPRLFPNIPIPWWDMAYQSYHQLAFPKEYHGKVPRVPETPFENCAYGPVPPLSHDMGNFDSSSCCDPLSTPLNSSLLEEFKAKWMRSQFCKDLVGHLEAHADNMNRVLKVVGIGLGALRFDRDCGDEEESGYFARSYLQHIAAVVIRDTLKRVQNTPHIDIVVQDPGYCTNCENHLRTKYGMRVNTDPGGLLAVDNNTFVLTKAPGINIRQIVMDITESYGGPAGILCDIIEDDGQVKDLGDDPSSPRCWEYKWKSYENLMAIELEDTAKTFGRAGIYLKERLY
jgi:hypothetical protein